MILYAVYKNYKPVIEEVKLPEHSIDVTKLSTVMDSEVQEMSSEPEVHDRKMIGMSCKLQNEHDQREKIMDFPNPNQLLGKCEA